MAEHSIRLTSGVDGWRWELLDLDGATVVAGSAVNQDKAMQAAWTAVRANTNLSTSMYPEILVDGRPRRDLAA